MKKIITASVLALSLVGCSGDDVVLSKSLLDNMQEQLTIGEEFCKSAGGISYIDISNGLTAQAQDTGNAGTYLKISCNYTDGTPKTFMATRLNYKSP